MKRLVECTCGHRYAKEFDNTNEWFCINKACCPVCTADLPPDSDPIWDDENYVQAAMTSHIPIFIIEEKSLYISGYDKTGVFRFSIPSGSQVPAGIIAGKGWTLKTEYRTNLKCTVCGDYLADRTDSCSCNK